MRKSSKIIALLVTLVMLVCALAVAINASTDLPIVTVSDKTNSYDMNALETQIHDETGFWFRGEGAQKMDAYVTRYLGFEEAKYQSYRVDSTLTAEQRKAMYLFKDYPCFFEHRPDDDAATGDAVAEVVGTAENHYLRFSSTEAGEGKLSFWYNIGQRTALVSTGNIGSSAAAGVIDIDFHADQYVKAGGGLTTNIAEAENGGKLAYSEANDMVFHTKNIVSLPEDEGEVRLTFEYDESANRWYICFGGGKMVLRPELNAWNHLTVVLVPFDSGNGNKIAAYAYLDGEFLGSKILYDAAGISEGTYPTYFGFYDTVNPYTPADMSLCFDNMTYVHYWRTGGNIDARPAGIITYADLFSKQPTQVHPESLNGTLKALVARYGDVADVNFYGKLGYSVYTEDYTYPAGTPYAATITRADVVDGFYALSQAAAQLQADDTLTIASGLVLNYKGNVSFTAVCDEGAITLPRDSEMALVRTADGYKVVPQSDVAEATTITLFPTYEDYEAATREEAFNSHDFTIIQGAPLDPEDADGNNYPDYIEWIVLDSETSVIAEGLSATDLATADMIANAAFIYPAPKADITVNWYTSKDAVTPFATATYKNGETIVAPDTTGVEGLDGKVDFNEYIDMIFGGTFVDAEGNAFVAGATASASVDYYAVLDTPQIKADYAKMAYVNYKLSVRQAVGILYAPITSEEGVTWSNGRTVEIGGKTYGVFYDNLYTNYSGPHNSDTEKTITVTVNGKVSAPVTIVVPQFANYLKYIIEHEDVYTAADRQLALDLTQFHALLMVAISPSWAGRFSDVVYQAHKTECTDFSKLTFEGDTKYDAPTNLPAGVKGVTLLLADEGWVYRSWRFALEVEDGFDLSANPIQVEYLTWDANGKPTTATLSFNEKVTIDGHTYVCCKDNPNTQPMATMTEDVTFKIGDVEFNYNLATYIKNVEAAEGDATLARAMYAFSKTLYAYVTAPVD